MASIKDYVKGFFFGTDAAEGAAAIAPASGGYSGSAGTGINVSSANYTPTNGQLIRCVYIETGGDLGFLMADGTSHLLAGIPDDTKLTGLGIVTIYAADDVNYPTSATGIHVFW